MTECLFFMGFIRFWKFGPNGSRIYLTQRLNTAREFSEKFPGSSYMNTVNGWIVKI